MDERKVPRRDFIRRAAAGLGVVGSWVSVGCGERPSGGSAASGERVIARVSEVPLGSAIEFRDHYSGELAVLVHLREEAPGRFVAYSVVCTHQGCPVAYNRERELLLCPCHGSVFDPARGGAAVGGPAQEPLQEIEVETEGSKVVVVRSA